MQLNCKCRIDGRNLVVEDDQGFGLTLPLYDLFQSLSSDDRCDVAEALTWDAVLAEAVKRLTDDSTSWSGDDHCLTLDVLCKMEKTVASGYCWTNLRNLNKALHNITSHTHLYWKLWHDEEHGQWFHQWARDNGIESSYTSKLPDYEALEALVKQAFADLKAGVPCVELTGKEA